MPTKLRLISAPPAVLCPPARMSPRVSPTYNLRVWCEENGELGERILEEWDDPEKGPEDVTRGSNYRARWKCRECGRTFHAQVHARTTGSKVSGPTGCRECLDLVATETHNLKVFCEESGGRLAHLPGEWNHHSKRMEDFTPASKEIVPWKCVKCGNEWDARIDDRTSSERPTGCPDCYTRGRTRKKPIEL